MKISSKLGSVTPPPFTPREVTITIESLEELVVLQEMTSLNVSIPDLMLSARYHDVVYLFLSDLHRLLNAERAR